MPINHQGLEFRRQALATEPHTFLQRTLLYAPHVGAPAASGVRHVYLFESRDGDGTRPGSYLGVHSHHSAENLMVQCGDPNQVAGGGAPRTMEHPLYNQNITFQAHWIATTFYPAPDDPNAPPAFPWYLLPNAGGPSLMFTQRLTGCCFLHRPAAGGVGTEVAHIMPTAGVEEGAELETRLREFFAGEDVEIYGRSRYQQGREATIIGVRNTNARWQFFAQKRDAGAGAPNMRSLNEI